MSYSKRELFLKNRSDTKLTEISIKLGISKGRATLLLKKLGDSYKTFSYVEANQEKHNAHQEAVKEISKENLVYSGVALTGRCVKIEDGGKRSEKLCGKKSGKYYQSTNIIAGYVNRKSIALLNYSKHG